MTRFDVAPEAIGDLQEIWNFIAQDSIEAADRVLEEFDHAFHQLAEMPGMGHLREDLTSRDVLFWTVRSYLVIYRATVPLLVIAVLHGKRNVTKILRERPGPA